MTTRMNDASAKILRLYWDNAVLLLYLEVDLCFRIWLYLGRPVDQSTHAEHERDKMEREGLGGGGGGGGGGSTLD